MLLLLLYNCMNGIFVHARDLTVRVLIKSGLPTTSNTIVVVVIITARASDLRKSLNGVTQIVYSLKKKITIIFFILKNIKMRRQILNSQNEMRQNWHCAHLFAETREVNSQ